MANVTPTQDPKKKAKTPPFDESLQSAPGHESRMNVKPDFGEDSYVGHGRLRDRVALITGADSGIGRAVALAFAREGADVAIAYLDEHDDAKETKRIVEGAGRRALLIAEDLADAAACKRVVDKAVDAFGRIDILVNNAAVQGKAEKGSIEDLEPERVERTFRVNILAMFHLVRNALPHMREGSSIINVGSIQAYQPSAPILDYATTKGAIVTFTKGLAEHVIERGVRANCVAPGPVWTPLIVNFFEEKKTGELGANPPRKRPAQPKELASAFVFLASDDSSYVNGEVLGVTGGRPLG